MTKKLDALELPDELKGDTMLAQLKRAKAFNQLATEGDYIELEAKCRIADALEFLVQVESIDRSTIK